MLKNLLLLTLIILFSINFVGGQENNNKKSAQLIDEFADYNISSAKARLDNVVVSFQNFAANSRIYIMAYRTRYEPEGKNIRSLRWMKNYLVIARGIEANKVVTVDGGVTNCSLIQYWIVPEGETPEVKSVYKTFFDDPKAPRKFDEYYPALSSDSEGEYYEYGYNNSLAEFAAALKKEPQLNAYVIVYPEYRIEKWEDTDDKGRKITYRNVYKDKASAAAEIQKTIRSALIKGYKYPAGKVKVVFGGYRKVRTAELWILPRGEHPPVATPDSFPNFRKK